MIRLSVCAFSLACAFFVFGGGGEDIFAADTRLATLLYLDVFASIGFLVYSQLCVATAILFELLLNIAIYC